jgi:hypothetical protein
MRRQNEWVTGFYWSLFFIHTVLTVFEHYRIYTQPHEADCPEDIVELTSLLIGVALLAGHGAAVLQHPYFSRQETTDSTRTAPSLFGRTLTGVGGGALVQHVAAEAHRQISEPSAKAIALLIFYGAACYTNTLNMLSIASVLMPPQGAANTTTETSAVASLQRAPNSRR